MYLLLIELKVTTFQPKFVRQVLDYKTDLIVFQQNGRLVHAEIEPYLLCTSLNDTQRKTAAANGVNCTDYDPEQVLQYFYQHFLKMMVLALKDI